MIHSPLKVGFDLDGVILYNPARLARPLITGFKKLIFKPQKTTFTIPHTPLQKSIWTLLHKSSFFVASGFEQVPQLVQTHQIEAYLVTARFDFLKPDLDRWLKKIDADHLFKTVYFNQKNEQPHLYKRRILRQLQLDYFIEDNWDIVKNLSVDPALQHTKIFWIYNLLDRRIPYPYKYPVLNSAIHALPLKS